MNEKDCMMDLFDKLGIHYYLPDKDSLKYDLFSYQIPFGITQKIDCAISLGDTVFFFSCEGKYVGYGSGDEQPLFEQRKTKE